MDQRTFEFQIKNKKLPISGRNAQIGPDFSVKNGQQTLEFVGYGDMSLLGPQNMNTYDR